MKPSKIGGQAVIEGVMMKYKNHYAIAVRKLDKEIVVKESNFNSMTETGLTSLPIVRGVVAFIESMRIGTKTLSYSASFYEETSSNAEETSSNADEVKIKEKKEAIVMGITMAVSMIVAIAVFILLPFYISYSLRNKIPSEPLRGLIEGVLRVSLFVAYVKAISMLNDIKRVFMYHGAEHKTINCAEKGLSLTVKNVKQQSKVHKRCGTSFLLIVMLISILFFLFIAVNSIWMRMGLRLLLIPVIAGVAYEFIQLAGNSDSIIVEVLSKPGLWLQALTTIEPEDEMIEVAIASIKPMIRIQKEQEKTEQEKTEQEKTEQEKIEQEKTEQEKMEHEKIQEEQEKGDDILQIVDIDDEDEDDILSALDRYFESPIKEDKK